MKQWKCAVCGQIFEGEAPPVPCPVCGAGESAFSEVGTAADKWRCTVCGQVFDGASPPVPCPVCSAGESAFIRENVVKTAYRSDTEDRFVLIGGGIASLEAAKAIRERNKTASIKLVCKEGVIPYNRPALSDVVGDGLSFEAVMLQEYSWYEENRIELICDSYCTRLDTAAKTAILSDGRALSYSKLLLATGANAFIPPYETDASVPCASLRIFADAADLYENAKNKKVIVAGGGILGIEAALALRERGCSVSVVELAGRLMSLQADEHVSELLKTALVKHNIKVFTGASISKIVNGAAVLSSGESLKAELVLFCIGVRAETSLACEAGLLTKRGIIINEHMQTSDADIYAAGDCAQYQDRVFGLYSAAAASGQTAGAAMAGEDISFSVPVAATAFTGAGLTLFSAGAVEDEHYASLIYKDDASGVYQKLLYDKKVLVGAVLLGDVSRAGEIISAIGSKRMYNLKL